MLFGKPASTEQNKTANIQEQADIDEMLAASQEESSDNRANVYLENGVAVYRASSFGGCTTSLVWSRRGFGERDAPDLIKKKYTEGNLLEQKIIRMFCEGYGFKRLDNPVLYERFGTYDPVRKQIETEFKIGDTAIIRCHPDEIVVANSIQPSLFEQVGMEWEMGEEFVLEVKAFSKSFHDKFLAEGFDGFAGYDWQFNIEMLTTHLPGVFCIGVKNEAGDDIEFLDVYFKEPWRSGIDCMKRVMFVENTAKMVDDGFAEMPDCEYKQWPCPHWDKPSHETGVWLKKTGDISDPHFKGVIDVVAPDIAARAPDEYRLQLATYKMAISKKLKGKYDAEYKEAQAELDRLLISEMGGTEGDYWHLGAYKLDVRKFAGKLVVSSENKVKMKQAGFDLRKYQTRNPDSFHVQINEREKDD